MKEDKTYQRLFSQVYDPFFQALTEWHTAFVEQVRVTLEALAPALQGFYNAVHTAYTDAGAPYGDTHEGLLRWVEERGEIARLQMEADRIEQHHKDMVELRELGRKIAHRRAG